MMDDDFLNEMWRIARGEKSVPVERKGTISTFGEYFDFLASKKYCIKIIFDAEGKKWYRIINVN